MEDRPADKPPIRPSLAAALRAARADDAERSEVVSDLRSLALARLGVLRDALEPVLLQLPERLDLFDIGLMPGDPPRLFIDMIAFVEMARDRRHYCFYQDRRHGRVLLAEAEALDDAVDAVTSYIARRLVERERALASDAAGDLATGSTRSSSREKTSKSPSPDPPPSRGVHVTRGLGQVFWFVVEVLGLLALFGLAFAGLRALLKSQGLWF